MEEFDPINGGTRLGGFFVEKYRIYWTAASPTVGSIYRLTPTIVIMGNDGETAFLQFWKATEAIAQPHWDPSRKNYYVNYPLEAFAEVRQLLEKSSPLELVYKTQENRVWVHLQSPELTHSR